MEIITFAAVKGGVGKTTLSYNFSAYLADLGYKVLMIDFDHQCNLSQILGIYDQKNTVLSIFEKIDTLHIEEKVKIHRINDNIDLISGFLRLDEYEKHMSTTDGKDMQLYMWLDDYYEEYNIGQYDYIIIDTSPVLGTSDALSIGQLVDSVLFVARYDVSTVRQINYSIERLQRANVKVEGIIFNDAKQSLIGAYNYHYGYEYKSKN